MGVGESGVGFLWEAEAFSSGFDACGALSLGFVVVAGHAEGFKVGECVLSTCCSVVFVVGVEGSVARRAAVSAVLAGVVVAAEAGLLECAWYCSAWPVGPCHLVSAVSRWLRGLVVRRLLGRGGWSRVL